MKTNVLCIYWTENPDLRHSRAPADNPSDPHESRPHPH